MSAIVFGYLSSFPADRFEFHTRYQRIAGATRMQNCKLVYIGRCVALAIGECVLWCHCETKSSAYISRSKYRNCECRADHRQSVGLWETTFYVKFGRLSISCHRSDKKTFSNYLFCDTQSHDWVGRWKLTRGNEMSTTIALCECLSWQKKTERTASHWNVHQTCVPMRR